MQSPYSSGHSTGPPMQSSKATMEHRWDRPQDATAIGLPSLAMNILERALVPVEALIGVQAWNKISRAVLHGTNSQVESGRRKKERLTRDRTLTVCVLGHQNTVGGFGQLAKWFVNPHLVPAHLCSLYTFL